MELRGNMKQAMVGQVGVGEDTNLWHDNWLSGGPIVGRLTKEEAAWVGLNSTNKVAQYRLIRWPRGRRVTQQIRLLQEQMEEVELSERKDQ
ncbi:hypothetical protein LIER_25078 [Lithospermum erythrorhizon]|uniref:Uncharacterized protein n=1 Tax=Lithospermum erythrorhizon TaxID=34254 RepID=A0AAV3R6M1_LITER